MLQKHIDESFVNQVVAAGRLRPVAPAGPVHGLLRRAHDRGIPGIDGKRGACSIGMTDDHAMMVSEAVRSAKIHAVFLHFVRLVLLGRQRHRNRAEHRVCGPCARLGARRRRAAKRCRRASTAFVRGEKQYPAPGRLHPVFRACFAVFAVTFRFSASPRSWKKRFPLAKRNRTDFEYFGYRISLAPGTNAGGVHAGAVVPALQCFGKKREKRRS